MSRRHLMLRILPPSLLLLVAPAILHASGLVLPGGNALRDRETFAAIDINGDGRVSKAEYVQFELKRRFEAIDLDRDGRITRDEYLAAVGKTAGSRAASDAVKPLFGKREVVTFDDFQRHDGATKEISAQFDRLDRSGRGYVTVEQWTKDKRRGKAPAPGK